MPSRSTTVSSVLSQKTMQDLIKGMRSNKGGETTSEFISMCIAEIKEELTSTDPFTKAEAIRKLTFLQMQGYDISWAAFAIVEVMGQPRFAHKRIGYLAANQSFTDTTDVMLLTTNNFKKEFSSSSSTPYDIGVGINSLANIANKDLARDCISDLVTLMRHNRAYVRKKAALAMYKMYLKFPQGLRLTFDKLSECLDDPEMSVVSCAVNVICELANKNPRNYLEMAPKFFKLLTTSNNNWMLIKIVKLMGSLVPEEPRLARKLLDPLSKIVTNTTAKSLQYECVNTITIALPHSKRDDGSDHKSASAVIAMCSEYLKGFIEDKDPNLKYLGLVGLVTLMPTAPRVVVQHREIILHCLNDDDVTIRTRALELLSGIVSKKSLRDLVHHLLEHIKYADGQYKEEIIKKVLYMCMKDKYALLVDFAWYCSILINLATTQGTKHGRQVADQLVEVALRVESVRPYAVEASLTMLFDQTLAMGAARENVAETLRAAAWIAGEYSVVITSIANDAPSESENQDDESDDDDDGFWMEGPGGDEILSKWRGEPAHEMVLKCLLDPRATNLPPHVQRVYLQSAMKIFMRACCDCSRSALIPVMAVVRGGLNIFLQSLHIEVQERATTFRRILDEFDILPMGWEEVEREAKRQVEEETVSRIAENNKSATEEGNLMDLEFLDFSVVASSVNAATKDVDEKGVDSALLKKHVLATLVAEPFYAVHPKAQRRVPKPDGIDMNQSMNPVALDNVLTVELPFSASINDIRLCDAPTAPMISECITSFSSDSVDLPEMKAFSSTPNSSDVNTTSDRGSSSNSAANSNYAENAMFNLGGISSTEGRVQAQLGDILASSFEDTTRKKRKEPKVRRKKSMVSKDLLPSGVSDSDDEPLVSRAPRRKKLDEKHFKDRYNDPLANIDLKAAVADDEEQLPEFKHRETPSYIPEVERRAISTAIDRDMCNDVFSHNDASKKSKKEKKSSKRDKKDKADTGELLDIGQEFEGLTASITPAYCPPIADEIVVTPMAEKIEKTEKKLKKSKKEKKEKKEKKSSKKSRNEVENLIF